MVVQGHCPIFGDVATVSSVVFVSHVHVLRYVAFGSRQGSAGLACLSNLAQHWRLLEFEVRHR